MQVPLTFPASTRPRCTWTQPVERVDIGADGLGVRLRTDGLAGLAREMQAGDIETAA